ncbi:MAG: hypothetical protein FWD61_15155 [Phycisphaerales bacterium]|nr:hypothetical protein [Phycisphaerales bacterium]
MSPQSKRHILIALLCATGLATLGILAIFLLTGSSSYHGGQFAILSGMGIGFLVAIAFAAFTALDHPIYKFLAIPGMLVAGLTMLIHPFMAFLESMRFYSYSSTAPSYDNTLREAIERINGTGFAVAGLLCLSAFILTPNIKSLGRILQLLVVCAYLLLFIFMLSVMWGANPGREFETPLIAAIFFAVAGTIAVSLLNKFFGIKIKKPVTYSATTLHLQCPRCQTFQDLPEGESVCRSCKLKFKIEIEEPLCPTCGYNLHNLTSARCPECGTMITVLAPGSAGGGPANIDTGPTEQTPGRAGD